MTEEFCLLTRLRKWHAANLPEDISPYNSMDIKDMVPEVIDYIEELEYMFRLIIEHPVEQSKQWEVGCHEMKKVAKFALGGKKQSRIKQLEWLLEQRDAFIVKNGLWHEFCDSLELKDETSME